MTSFYSIPGEVSLRPSKYQDNYIDQSAKEGKYP